MKDELLVLLGCGLTALLVTNACTPMFKNNENDEYSDGYARRQQKRQYDIGCEGFNGCGSSAPAMPASSAAVDYYSEPARRKEEVSPLFFGEMVSNEPFIESDYIDMKHYTNNPDEIKVYNEKNDTIGLPVTDMTDISPGENNKYVYDRTIGTIGFTSTKIGGRSRGNADYIRGDLAIVPNKDTGWFQTSADPANKLMVGAINQANGIGNAKTQSSSGAQHALGGPIDMDSLRDQQQSANELNKPGAQHALGSMIPEVTVADIIKAAQTQNSNFANAIGVKSA